jgi:hypothetical protein
MALRRTETLGGSASVVVFTAALLQLFCAGVGCGGGTSLPAGTGGTQAAAGIGGGGSAGGLGGGGGTASTCVVAHRPAVTACPETPVPSYTSCQSDADCPIGGGPISSLEYCRVVFSVQQCTYDACLADSDCPDAADTCVCQGQSFGYSHTSFGNVCEAGNCHQDSDCGGDLCSPSISSGGAFWGVAGS